MESADAESAVSAYRQAQASTVQARSTLAKVETDFVREKDLFSHEAAPQKDLLSAEALAVQAQAVVDQAEAVVEQAKKETADYRNWAGFLRSAGNGARADLR